MTTKAIGRLQLVGGAAGVLAVWFLGMAVAALVLEPQDVIVFARRGDAIVIAAGTNGLIMISGRNFVVAHSSEPRFVQRLYQNGAWLVWPSMPRGCLGIGP